MQGPADHEGESERPAERVVPLDRARTFITLSVVLYHSAINYTHFGIGGDRMRWLGFDLLALFNDSYFMACMFFISGLFVHGSLARRGALAHALSFALFCASMTFTVPAAFLRFAQTPFRLLDAMRPSAYGIYLLHFVPLLWLQYLVYDPAFPAFVKFAIVFAGTLSASWVMTIVLRKFLSSRERFEATCLRRETPASALTSWPIAPVIPRYFAVDAILPVEIAL